MTLPILNLKLPPRERWRKMLYDNPALASDWFTVLEEFQEGAQEIIDAIPSWRVGVSRLTHRMLNHRFAANLNQAPVSNLCAMRLPALWWFRANLETGKFLRSVYAPPGGMTNALIHVTHRSGTTHRIYYKDGVPEIWAEQLGKTPVILTNTYDSEDVEEDPDFYDWCKWREEAILNSKRRTPRQVLAEAECEDTVFRWDTNLG